MSRGRPAGMVERELSPDEMAAVSAEISAGVPLDVLASLPLLTSSRCLDFFGPGCGERHTESSSSGVSLASKAFVLRRAEAHLRPQQLAGCVEKSDGDADADPGGWFIRRAGRIAGTGLASDAFEPEEGQTELEVSGEGTEARLALGNR